MSRHTRPQEHSSGVVSHWQTDGVVTPLPTAGQIYPHVTHVPAPQGLPWTDDDYAGAVTLSVFQDVWAKRRQQNIFGEDYKPLPSWASVVGSPWRHATFTEIVRRASGGMAFWLRQGADWAEAKKIVDEYREKPIHEGLNACVRGTLDSDSLIACVASLLDGRA